MPVPPQTLVQPGAPVSIILKADQRSGRQVQGTVGDVLTRGNHPRGIKVRLTDGRIGRVQRMAVAGELVAGGRGDAEEEVERDLATQARVRGPDRGAGAGGGGRGGRGGYRSERLGSRYTDMRLDEGGAEAPQERLDLMAFAKVARPKKGKRGGGGGGGGASASASASASAGAGASTASQGQMAEEESVAGVAEFESAMTANTVTATCPVCGIFEGDEVAVSRHVESHFT